MRPYDVKPPALRWRALPCCVVLCVVFSAPAAQAETTFTNVQLVVGRHGQSVLRNPGLDHVAGTLTIDADTGRLLFEAAGRPPLEIGFGALVALHYEESKFPRRVFGRRTPYLTVHHTAANGEPDSAVFRLPEEASPDILAAVERDTGRAVDRSESTVTFLGLPIHAGVGTVVYVTDESGRRTKGRVTKLDTASIDLDTAGRFDAATITKVQVADPVWGGLVVGAFVSLLPAAAITVESCVGSTSCHQWGPLTPAGWGVVAAGGLVGALIDARKMRHAYRRVDGTNPPALQWNLMPVSDGRGVQVSFRF